MPSLPKLTTAAQQLTRKIKYSIDVVYEKDLLSNDIHITLKSLKTHVQDIVLYTPEKRKEVALHLTHTLMYNLCTQVLLRLSCFDSQQFIKDLGDHVSNHPTHVDTSYWVDQVETTLKALKNNLSIGVDTEIRYIHSVRYMSALCGLIKSIGNSPIESCIQVMETILEMAYTSKERVFAALRYHSENGTPVTMDILELDLPSGKQEHYLLFDDNHQYLAPIE